MAYLHSVCFFTPFTHPNTLFQGSDTRRYNDGRFMNPVTNTKGGKHWAHRHCGESMILLNRLSCWSPYAPSIKLMIQPMACHLDVKACCEVVISGFWVGPDMDDGWGFVEASIRQIF